MLFVAVIFEYKVRLEKSLAEEKSSNAVVKQELQQRASREKSLRDKDSVEAMQRFNSLQQTHKLLQTENKDLKEECEKQQKQALEDTKKLEATLRDLRGQIREASRDKEKSMEHLKNKYLELETEKSRLEDKYNAVMKSNGDTDSTIQHLQKQVMQLERELTEAQVALRIPSTILLSTFFNDVYLPSFRIRAKRRHRVRGWYRRDRFSNWPSRTRRAQRQCKRPPPTSSREIVLRRTNR